MCGIAGILRVWTPEQREVALATPHVRSIPEPWLDILDDAVKHRGPDGRGRFRDRAIRGDGCVVDVAFVHRRLSIIDHAGGHQPMVWGRWDGGAGILPPSAVERHTERVVRGGPPESRASDGTIQDDRATDVVAVIFNGCIYNHRELRSELQRAGHVFHTDHSDTEVLVHGWKAWKGHMLQHLDGMYAFSVWDGGQGVVYSARDRFGEKPLFGTALQRDGSLVEAFASTAGALLRLRAALDRSVPPEPARWSGWLSQGYSCWGLCGVSEDGTAGGDHFEGMPGVRPFGPAHELGHHRNGRLGESELDDLLASAVQSRLEADVSVGCLLSGGVDSSLVASFANRQLRGELRTITVRMPDARFDESAYGERVAAAIGSRHTTVDCNASPASDLAQIIPTIGLPFGDSSLLPTLWAHRAIGGEIRVALTGDGGDELFGGYERYRAADMIARLGLILSLVPTRALKRNDPTSKSERLARLVDAARAGDARDLERIFPTSLRRSILTGPIAEAEHSIFHGHNSAALLMAFDLLNYLPFDLMRKSDSASMQVPVESRAPMLANAVSIAAMNARIDDLMPRGQRKGLLRQVARKYLPAEIVDRPKMGFAIPIGEWFRTDYGGLRTMLLDHLNSTEPFGPPSLGIDLNMKFIRQMLDEHLGTGPSGRIVRDHSQRLYMLLVLSIWAKWLGSLRS